MVVGGPTGRPRRSPVRFAVVVAAANGVAEDGIRPDPDPGPVPDPRFWPRLVTPSPPSGRARPDAGDRDRRRTSSRERRPRMSTRWNVRNYASRFRMTPRMPRTTRTLVIPGFVPRSSK